MGCEGQENVENVWGNVMCI